MPTKSEKAAAKAAADERARVRDERTAWSDQAESTENMAQMLRRNVLRDDQIKAEVAVEVAARLREVADTLERTKP